MDAFSRRQLLAAGAAGFAMGAGMNADDANAKDEPLPPASSGMGWSVKDFGAKGDGKTDDTSVFQKAIDAAHEKGGGTVFIPPGNHLIAGRLTVREHVALRGVWQAPTARTQNHGSCLLAVEGAGKPDGPPFITLHQNGTLRGLTVFHPEQKEDVPVPYPWTIKGEGDNCSLVDVLLVNPYMAVDFGTGPAGRHYIDGLYAQAIHRGLFIDNCFDIGRVKDVHFWPFWHCPPHPIYEYTEKHGEAFIIGRTDWEYMLNCFCIGFSVGFRFIANKDHGGGNALLTQCGSDVGPLAVKVDRVQDHSGISFCNSQMMATVEIGPENRGPVKFTSCGFWPVGQTRHQIRQEGDGILSLSHCHFAGWDKKNEQVPAIIAERGIVKVNACDFLDRDKAHIRLGKGARAASIVGNSFAGGMKLANESAGDVQTPGNVNV